MQELRRSAAAGDVRVGDDRGWWREVFRGLPGVPDDHPTRDELVSAAREGTVMPIQPRLASDS